MDALLKMQQEEHVNISSEGLELIKNNFEGKCLELNFLRTSNFKLYHLCVLKL
jgi:hypothetical protein